MISRRTRRHQANHNCLDMVPCTMYKELGANERVKPEHEHWFWPLAAGGGHRICSEDGGWWGASISSSASCSMGAPSSVSGTWCSSASSGKMIWFLSGVSSFLTISCFLQKIFAELSNSGRQNSDNRKRGMNRWATRLRELTYVQYIKIRPGRMSSQALCSEPLGPFLDLKRMSLQKGKYKC